MEIVFSINNNAEIMVMPAAPEFEIAESQGNDTFQGLTVNIRMIGNKELRTMSLSSFFPSKRYPWMSPYADVNPQAYIDFFKSINSDGEFLLHLSTLLSDIQWGCRVLNT